MLSNKESVNCKIRSPCLVSFRGLFVVLEPGRIFSRLPGLIQVRENRVPASHLLRFVDVEPHPQWLVGAEGHRSWVVMSCSNNDSCNARGEKVYYVYCKLEHEAKQAHDCESSGRILTTWRQEAKTPIIVDSRLQFVQDPIVFIFVWTCKGDQEIGISRKFLAFWFSSCVVADAHPLPLLSQLHLSFQIVHCQGICQVFILCSTFNTFESSSDAAVVVGLSQLLIQLDGSREIFQKLRGGVPGRGVSSRGRSRPLPLQMSAENCKIWQQETRQIKPTQSKTRSALPIDMCTAPISLLSKEPCAKKNIGWMT